MKCNICKSDFDDSEKKCPYCGSEVILPSAHSSLDFKEVIESFVEGYDGKQSKLIKLTPKVYELLTLLMESKEIDTKDKLQLSATIAYFILPRDFYSEEEYGPIGFSDDLLLSIHTIKIFEKKYGLDWVRSFWKYDQEVLDKLLTSYYIELNKTMGIFFKGILEYVGLEDE